MGRRVGLALVIGGLVVGLATLLIDAQGLIVARYVALFVFSVGATMYRSARRDHPGRQPPRAGGMDMQA